MTVTSIASRHASRRTGTWILQGVVAVAFFAAGAAKLAGAAFMVQLFDQIGLGQWFRYVTGLVEVIGSSGADLSGSRRRRWRVARRYDVLRRPDPPVRAAHQPPAGHRARPT